MHSPSALDNQTFSFELDTATPSRLANTGGVSPWAYNLSPFKSFETNPFESSFSFAPYSTDKPLNAEDIYIDCTPGGSLGFGKRKRALSTPSLFTPGGNNINHLAFAEAMGDHKRPRIDTVMSSASLSSGSTKSKLGAETMTSFGGSVAGLDAEAEYSPVSSSIRTPPDMSSFLPQMSLDGSLLFSNANDKNPSSADFAVNAKPDVSTSSFTTTQFDPSPIATLSAALKTASTTGPAYQQFTFQQSTDTSAAPANKTFNAYSLGDTLLSQGTGNLPPSAHFQPAPSSAKDGKGKNDSVPKGKGAKGKKARAVSEAASMEGLDEMDGDDEEVKRKVFLERNRLAACKSRQKKKERVGTMEAQASELAAQNAHLQSVALSLRNEVYALRDQLNFHDTCSCEHVAGYLKREQAGGGIPTINLLAGRTLSLDFTNVPRMGSEDDVYASLVAPASVDATPSTTDGRSLPPVPAASATRAAAAYVTKKVAAGAASRGLPVSEMSRPGPPIPLKGKRNGSLSIGQVVLQAPPPGTFNPNPFPIIHRPSSAPPTTPSSWDKATADSYFAIAA